MSNIRQTILQRRQAIDDATRNIADTKIAEQLFALPCFQQSHSVACYHSYAGEVATQNIIEKIVAEKICYLPFITANQTLNFLRYTSETQLQKNQHGIAEPPFHATVISATELDLVIIPVVAFDADCNRLGWGLGYYDRALAFLNTAQRPKAPFVLGLAYELQKVDTLEKKAWDVTLDAVLTEIHYYQRVLC